MADRVRISSYTSLYEQGRGLLRMRMKHTKINLSKSPFYSVRVLRRGLCLSRLLFRSMIANKLSEALGFIQLSKDMEEGR